jgi:hypothetical protein
LQQEKNFPSDEARICLVQSDHVRKRYLRQNFDKDLDNPMLYHLMINTGLLDLPQAVKLITQTVQDFATE